ncbi:MAG: hypothetical protein CL908_19885 [Deltaproteobacteria bacterium]|jgi:uncharacterized repeat protein (TIGR04138 family)|nr:hypothetical protein [Deltaproteobacteria bacterium]
MTLSTENDERIRELVRTDPRYKAEAYVFTLEALNYTLEELKKTGHEGHIDGPQLLHGICDYACRLFGYLGAAVFQEWGVASTGDFGEVVFRLVDAQLLSKRDSDSKSDFEDVFDLQRAFESEFIHP